MPPKSSIPRPEKWTAALEGSHATDSASYGDRNAAPGRALYQGPNKRLRGMQQYLRMRKALKGISVYKIPDIITWQSMQK